jgi:hypothetical protein
MPGNTPTRPPATGLFCRFEDYAEVTPTSTPAGNYHRGGSITVEDAAPSTPYTGGSFLATDVEICEEVDVSEIKMFAPPPPPPSTATRSSPRIRIRHARPRERRYRSTRRSKTASRAASGSSDPDLEGDSSGAVWRPHTVEVARAL